MSKLDKLYKRIEQYANNTLIFSYTWEIREKVNQSLSITLLEWGEFHGWIKWQDILSLQSNNIRLSEHIGGFNTGSFTSPTLETLTKHTRDLIKVIEDFEERFIELLQKDNAHWQIERYNAAKRLITGRQSGNVSVNDVIRILEFMGNWLWDEGFVVEHIHQSNETPKKPLNMIKLPLSA